MLSDRDKATLDMEGRWWKYAAAKDSEVRRLFDESPTRYHQRLHALLRNPEALAYAPMTVRRLVRLQEARRAARSPR